MKKSMLLFLLPLLCACQREFPVQRQSVMRSQRFPPQPAAPAASFVEGTHAVDGVQKIRARVGEPFRVLEIYIYSDSLMLQAQDAKKPENVDQYRLEDDGEIKSTPVHLMGQTDEKTLAANLFDPSTVDLAKIPDIVREANEKVQLEGREFSTVSIRRNMF